MTDLRTAAQALVDRWDTPLWKDAEHTGKYIDVLRQALAVPVTALHTAIMDLQPRESYEAAAESYRLGFNAARHAAAELARAALSVPAVPEAVADERKRLANRLRYETELEGFGCACSPSQQCATCKARDVLNKVLGPLIREFEAAPSPQEPTDV